MQVNVCISRLVDFTGPGRTHGSVDLRESHKGLHLPGLVNLHVSMENLSNPTENQMGLELKMFQGLRSDSDEILTKENFPLLNNIVLIAHFYSS